MFNNNEKLLFKSLFGSHLYGTNSESSDTDYKGVFLPNKENLLLGNYPKFYNNSTAGMHERNTKEDIDETYYSLHYFLNLLTLGETNCLDLFFANTNKNAVQYEDPIWTELTKNADKLITKNVNKYLGYCRSQAIKYSIKGDKLNNYNAFKEMCDKYISYKNKDGAHISLEEALEIEYPNNTELKKAIANANAEKIKINLFGEHCYILHASNKEIFLSISDAKFCIFEDIVDIIHKCNRTINHYGKRAEIAAAQNGADYKALSHAIRVLYQAEELLTTNKITFPLAKEKIDFIKSIKYNTTNLSYQEIVDIIDKKIKYIDNELLPKSTLREKADTKWINNFILSLYNN